MSKIFKDLVNNQRHYLFIGFIIIAAVLALFLRDLVRLILVPPVLYVYWVVRIIYGTLPQLFWWGALMLGLLLIAARSLTFRSNDTKSTDPAHRARESRLEMWTKWLDQTRKGGYFRWYLAHELGRLYLSVLASRERLTNDQALTRLVNKKTGLPPDVQAYVETGLDARQSFTFGDLGGRLPFRSKSSPLDLEPEEIIEILESKLD
jgi:hypothetical protein